MSVKIGRARYVAGIAAVLYGIIGGGVALASHGSPPRPDFVTETDVPGAADSPITTDANAAWVVGAGPQIVRLPPGGPITTGPIALRPSSIAATGAGIWGGATSATDPPVATVFRYSDASQTAVTLSSDSGYQLFDVNVGSDNSLYFAEAQSGASAGAIGKIAGAPPFTLSPPNQLADNRVPYDLTTGTDGALWFLEHVNGTTKIGKLDNTDPTVPSPELDVGDVAAFSLIGAADGGLWFIETSPAGASITRMSITPPTVGDFTRHPLAAGVMPVDLASGAAGALWFTTGEAGNIGRMTPDGNYSLLCIGPGHPRAIARGPGTAMSFTEAEDRVGRISTSPTPSGAPCPPPPPPAPPAGGGGGPVKQVVKDRTAAKISLRGPRTQRFTKKGTIVVSVKCNEACRAVAQATVSVTGASKVYRSRNAARVLAPGKAAKLELTFQENAARTIVRSLRRGKRLKANLLIGARDLAGNASRVKRIVKLKR